MRPPPRRSQRLTLAALDLLALAALTALLVKPLLTPGQFRSHEMERYALRAQQMHEAHLDGHWWPRWAPDLARGYGYPIFNYYAPLSILVIEACHGVMGIDWPEAVKASIPVLSLLAAWGMWGLGQALWRWPGGLIAGAAYLFLPYRLVDAYFRGAIAELAAMSVLPWLLWAVVATLRRGGGMRMAGLAVAWAAIVLSHNVTALFAAPFAVVFALLVALGWPTTRRHLGMAALGLALGTGLSAIFWWPALAEKSYIIMDQAGMTTGYFDYHRHFLRLAQMFRRVVALYGISNVTSRDNMCFEMGNAALILTVLGLAGMAWRRPRPTRHLVLGIGSAAMVVVLAFAMTPASRWLWEHLPLMPYAQFPWRLLALTGVLVAMLAGSCVLWLPRRPWRRAALAVAAVALVSVNALPLMRVRAPLEYPPDFFTRESLRRIYKTTTGRNEFLPLTASRDIVSRIARPGAGEVLTGESASGVRDLNWRAGDVRFVVDAGQPTAAVLGVLAFPGWRGTVNGDRVDLSVDRRAGLLVAPLPAGRDIRVHVHLGLTGVQLAATVVSLLSLLAVIVAAVWDVLRRRGGSSPQRASP